MFRELLARPDVEEHSTLRGKVGFLAFHGGALERVTDVIASEAAERAGASYYGVLYPRDAEHVPSKDVDPEHSTRLREFLDHVDVAIALHGYGREDRRYDVLLGGRNREFARLVRVHLEAALPDYQHLDDLEAIPRELRGVHERNPVNRTPESGVQIELPPLVRWHREAHSWSDATSAGRAPQVEVLIDSLAEVAGAWR